MVAVVEARTRGLPGQAGDLLGVGVAAMGGNRDGRPDAAFKPLAGFEFVVKDGVFEKVGGHGRGS